MTDIAYQVNMDRPWHFLPHDKGLLLNYSFVGLVFISILLLQADHIAGIAYILLATFLMVIFVACLDADYALSDYLMPPLCILYLQAVVYPGYILLTGNMRFYLYADSAHADIVPGIMVWIAAIFTFYCAVLYSRSRHPRQPIQVDDVQLDERPLLVATLLIIICMIGTLASVYLMGGVDVMTNSRMVADKIRLSRGLGIFKPLIYCSYVAVAYLGWHAFAREKINKVYLCLGLLYVIIGSIHPILMARRGPLLWHLAIFIAPSFSRYRWVLVRKYLPLLLLGLFLFDLFSGLLRRSYYETNTISLEHLERMFSEGDVYTPMSFNQLELTAALISKIDSGEFEPMYGDTFIAGLLNWLPRKVFPEKQWTGGPYLADAMTSGYSFDDRQASSSMTTGIILETTMNFKYYGILPVLFLVGLLYSKVFTFLDSHISSIVWASVRSLGYVFLSFGLFADDFGGLVNKIFCLSLGCILLKLFCRNRSIRLEDNVCTGNVS